MMKATEIAKLLGVDDYDVRKSKGVFRYHASYFWGMTGDGSTLEKKVLEKVPNAVILEKGNHWHSFVGGAESGSSKDSYLWVKFMVNEQKA